MNLSRKWYQFKRDLKSFFYPKTYMNSRYNKNARIITRVIASTLADKNTTLASLQITDAKINGNVVTITLGRPGLLIGKAGTTIDTVADSLSMRFNKPIRIHIVESFIFPNF